MSYNSKKTIANLISGVLVCAAYAVFALGNHAPKDVDIKSWAIAILIFIAIGVAVIITVQIVFHIVSAAALSVKDNAVKDEDVERNLNSLTTEDERDKLIIQKADRIGYSFAGLGFLAMLIALAIGTAAVPALHIMFGSLALGSAAGGVASIYFYEKGISNE